MKKITVLLILISTSSFAQIYEPVKWSTSIEKISEVEYNLIFTAQIEHTWHLYSQNIPENGPLPTVFIFEKQPNYKLIGKVSEPEGKTVYEKVFDMKIKYFETRTIFKQRIKRIDNQPFKIVGEIEFTSCNNEQCLTGYDDFEIEL